MQLQRVSFLRGPNIHARVPVLAAELHLRRLRDATSDRLAGFTGRLKDMLAALERQATTPEPHTAFAEHLERGLHLAEVLAYLAVRLQQLAGSDVRFSRVLEATPAGVCRLVVECEEEPLARACLDAARTLCLAAVHGEPCDAGAVLARVRDVAHDVRLGPSTGAIVRAALRRNIPVRRLNRDSLVQLGHGARQRRICTAETDATSLIAENIAKDKELTRTLLKTAGVPVPAGRPVRDAEDAWEAAVDLGLPVVVKPRDGNHGRGVAVNLSTREQVLRAYAAARQESEQVVVETFIPGDDYRVLVIGNRMVAAAHREPAQVVGDGRSTVEELIAEVNRDPRRSDGHATVLSLIKIDAVALAVLAEQGFTPTSVPAAGRRVLIRRNANLSTGGTAVDVTDRVHPEVARRVAEAARVVGLDIAGIDLVVKDISRPLESQGGAVVEANAGPGLRMHLEPSAGQPRPVGEAVVDLLFPANASGRVPVVAVTGEGRTFTARLLAHLLRTPRRVVGLSCAGGTYVNGRCTNPDDGSGPGGAEALLSNPRVDLAVVEADPGRVVEEGLGFDECAVAVVTDAGVTAGIDQAGTDAQGEPARPELAVVATLTASGTAVLNAEDPEVVAMGCRCLGEVVYFATERGHPVLQGQRQAGGRTVYFEEGGIVFAHGEREVGRVALSRRPLTYDGHVALALELVLAAAAGAWALTGSADTLRAGLDSFFTEGRPHWARASEPVLVG